jgi:hypothetical protein
MTVGLGAAFVAATVLSPLMLKTTPSDLDLYFWPSAQTIVNGHPLLIYATHLRDTYPNANGPLGLIPLVPIVALADALGWAGSLAGRAALTGAAVSVFVLLLVCQLVRLSDSAGAAHRPRAIACTVLLAPALWIAVLDYGHVEQPIELCLVLVAIRCSLRERNVLTGIALGAAVLTRTIAGFCLIPFILAPLASHRIRATAVMLLAAGSTVAIGIAPFFVANESALLHSLLAYRGSLPIGGGSFWIIARNTSLQGVVKASDVYLGAALAVALVAVALRRRPAIATTYAGAAGLVTIASCCFPLFAKTVFPYYLLEPYVFATLWWLARPGSARSWRAVVPLLVTVDVFIVKAASVSPFSSWGIIAGVTSSVIVALAVALVMVDLLGSPQHAVVDSASHGRSTEPRRSLQEAR